MNKDNFVEAALHIDDDSFVFCTDDLPWLENLFDSSAADWWKKLEITAIVSDNEAFRGMVRVTVQKINDAAMFNARCKNAWRYRENDRMKASYKRLPDLDLIFKADHFVHLSNDDRDLIAYTASKEKGWADKQTVCSLRAYLNKYKDFYELGQRDIDKLVLDFKMKMKGSSYNLCFSSSVSELNRIFETELCARSSENVSCMCGKFNENEHRPYHVYNTEDVCVAYLLEGDAVVVARSVINQKDKQYVRLYGTSAHMCDILEEMLIQRGYDKGDLVGCKLKAVRNGDDELLLPYMDEVKYVALGAGNPQPEYLYVVRTRDEANFIAECVDGGYTRTDPRQSALCPSCEDNYYVEDLVETYGGVLVCQSCLNTDFRMLDDDQYYRKDDCIFICGRWYYRPYLEYEYETINEDDHFLNCNCLIREQTQTQTA